MNKKDKFKRNLMIITESTVYMILLILAIFLDVFGDVYIKMVPLLFILGIVGKLVFNRPIITSIFGGLITYILMYIQTNNLTSENMYYSIYIALLILLGEAFGKVIEMIMHHKKKLNILNINEKIVLISLLFIILIFSFGVNVYTNGDIFNYMKAQEKLEKYLYTNYGEDLDFKVLNSKYTFLGIRSYTFYVKSNLFDGQLYKYVIYLNDNVYDEYKSELMEKNNNEIKETLQKYINDKKISDIYKSYNIDLKYVNLNDIELKIEKNTKETSSISQEEILEFSKDVANILYLLKEYENYSSISKVNLKLYSTKDIYESSIKSLDFDKGYEYIDESLKPEYIE